MDNELFQFNPRWQLQRLMAEQQKQPRSFDFDFSPLNSIVASSNSPVVSNRNTFGVHEMLNHDPSFVEFSGDPGFAERAATFSRFNGGRTGYDEMEMGSVSDHDQMLNLHEDHCLGLQDSKQCGEFTGRAIFGRNEYPVFDKFPPGESGLNSSNEINPRKRKALPKRKADELAFFPTTKHIKVLGKGEVDTSTSQEKKKIKDQEHENGVNIKSEGKEQGKIDDPPKDYIHVRARRGEATDSHSLAERARREKIGERMKLLQDLVPGCDRVTGKAVMLDEIINYVQSLQRQVEFLSMKLASVNFKTTDTRVESNDHVSKNIHQVHESSQSGNMLGSKQCQDQNMQLPSLEGLLQCFPRLESLSDGDLERLVQMGLARF